MCLFQLFVASSRLEILFSNEQAGASFGRSAVSRKKWISKLRSFPLLSGAKVSSLIDFSLKRKPINQLTK